MSSVKALLAISSFLMLGVVSCSACSKQDQLPAPLPAPTNVPPPAPQAFVLSNANLEVSVPNNNWGLLKTEGSFKAFLNSELNNLLLLSKQETTETFDQYILNNVRGIKDSGGTLLASKQLEINGRKFVFLDSSRDTNKVYMWLTLDNGFGYILACGGPPGEDQKDLCSSIASTIKVN